MQEKIRLILRNSGLNENEVTTYVALLRTGSTPVSRLVKETGLKRTTLYDSLSFLAEKSLCGKIERNDTTYFHAEHPRTLEVNLEKQERALKHAKEDVTTLIPDLLALSKPGLTLPKVKMFEGEEGIRKVLFDSLSATETIYTYVSVDDMETHIRDINQEYLAERIRHKITKKALVLDTPFARNFLKKYDTSATEFRLFSQGSRRFHCEVNIYDGKIGYLTYQEGRLMGVLIEEADMASIQRMAFDHLWKTIKPFYA